jgi:integrase
LAGKFTARQIARLPAGLHGDGGGLYLNVTPSGTRSWVVRCTVRGMTTRGGRPKRMEIGLGPAELVTLAEAREEALRIRRLAHRGIDPLAERRRRRLTFEEAARECLEELRPTWRNSGHGDRWLRSLENYAFPEIGRKPVDEVTTADCKRVLRPIWTTKHDTAARVRQRIGTVMDWARGAGHREAGNPIGPALDRSLPNIDKAVKHFAALPWRELPGFYSELCSRTGLSALALRFLILTAGRSGEIRGATWEEIDLDARLWTIPATRMQSFRASDPPHRVPLSAEAVRVLEAVRGLDDTLVFPSQKVVDGRARPMSDAVFRALLDRMQRRDFTAHGFRTSFRTWCAEADKTRYEAAEIALSHRVGTTVARAYDQSDLLDDRRSLMDRWAAFVLQKGNSEAR